MITKRLQILIYPAAPENVKTVQNICFREIFVKSWHSGVTKHHPKGILVHRPVLFLVAGRAVR